MSGLTKFQKAMLEAFEHHLAPGLEEREDELAKVMENHLFNLEGPRQLDRRLKASEEYFGRVFRGFTEITTSLEILDDIAFYIGRFPFEGTRITRERYIQFHVEAHYNEIYILKERLTKYIKLFQRKFKRDPQLPNIMEQCASLENYMAEILRGVVELRGEHTHKLRFADDHIDRLSTIGLLTLGPDTKLSKFMRNYYRKEHKEVRKIWRNRIRDNVKAIRQLIDAFFEGLFPMVFDSKTGILRIPHGIRT